MANRVGTSRAYGSSSARKSSRIENSAHRLRSRSAAPSSAKNSSFAAWSVGSAVITSSNWSKMSTSLPGRSSRSGQFARYSATVIAVELGDIGAGAPAAGPPRGTAACSARSGCGAGRSAMLPGGGSWVSADDRQHLEAVVLQLRDQPGLDQRRLPGAGGRVQQHDPLGDRAGRAAPRSRGRVRRAGRRGGRTAGRRRGCRAPSARRRRCSLLAPPRRRAAP